MKHVLITGSTRGIGFGLAKSFLGNNYKVTVNGTTQAGVDNAIKLLKEIYPNAKVQGFSYSVTNHENVKNLWNDAVNGFGEIDIWINNAGIGQGYKYTWDIDSAYIDNIVDINIKGVMYGSLVALENMKNQGHGQIYNMEGFGSDGMMMKKMTLYGTTKRGLRYFTRSLAKEAKDTQVVIGTLNPGMVKTDLLTKSLEENPEEAEKSKKIFNILADEVDTVTSFLVKEIIKNNKNGAHISWLTKGKMTWRFMISPFYQRDLFK